MKNPTILALVLLALLAASCSQAATPQSLPAQLAPAAASTVAWPAAEPLITPTAVPVSPTPAVLALGRLTVEEYPILAADVDTPNHIEFAQRIAPVVLAGRRAQRSVDIQDGLRLTNQALAPLGYRLVERASQSGPQPVFDLMHGDALVQGGIAVFYPASVSASGRDFAFVVDDAGGGQWLVRSRGSEPWEPWTHGGIRPVLVGDDLVSVDATASDNDWEVRRGDEVVYTVRDQPILVANPLKSLWSWDGHWVLEVDGHVIVDGEDLGQQLGYDEVFAWQLLAGQPFYFFEQDGHIGVSYAGETLAPRYDEVIHYQCCEPAAFNVAGNGTMVWGYALRDGMWHYVEMGVY